MTIYEVHTMEGRHYRRHKPKRDEMFAYIRQKMSEGYRLSAITFCWTRISVR